MRLGFNHIIGDDWDANNKLLFTSSNSGSIDNFFYFHVSKHVKAQKLVRESIARMTSRPLFKVEDDLKELRQQLHEVATMLQTNSVAVEKLKKESTNVSEFDVVLYETRCSPQ